MEEFRCSKCKKKKLKSNFHKSKNAKNGISNWCADCSNETDRIRKLKRRPPPGHRRCIDCKEIKELNQENFKKNRKNSFTLRCLDCRPLQYYSDQKRKWGSKRRANEKNNIEDIPKNTYDLLVFLYGNKCSKCGKLRFAPHQKFLHIDHINPLNKGGAHAFWNFQLLCYVCNGGKKDRNNDDFRVEKIDSSFSAFIWHGVMIHYKFKLENKDEITKGFFERLESERT